MKTLLGKLLLHFDLIAHPAAGRSTQKPDNQRKRKATPPISIKNSVSPDCFAMRTPSKKQQQLRRTPAP